MDAKSWFYGPTGFGSSPANLPAVTRTEAVEVDRNGMWACWPSIVLSYERLANAQPCWMHPVHDGSTIEALITEVLRLGYHQHQCVKCQRIYWCEHRQVCVPRSEQEAAELLCGECEETL